MTNRSGNALVLTMVVLSIAATLVYVTTDSAYFASRSAQVSQYRRQALNAAETVAISRETVLQAIAAAGDVTAFTDQTDPRVVGNYGETWLGQVRVRWKVEPAIVESAAPVLNEGWTYITNPSGITGEMLTAPRKDNPIAMLYRIAADGAVLGQKNPATGIPEVVAEAQVVRFVSVDKTPLFRYVLFYGQKGQAGDIELTHGPKLELRGPVHSNGAIYLGGGTQVNDWAAVQASSGSTATTATTGTWLKGIPIYDRATVIGPDASDQRVKVTGVDGIYRLSKATMYGVFNGFPMMGVAPAGGTGGSSSGDGYSMSTATVLPGELNGHYNVPTGTDTFASVTNGGTQINPARVLAQSGCITIDTGGDGGDGQRLINGVPIRGVTKGLGLSAAASDSGSGSTVGNDSRDLQRAWKWKTDSLGPATKGGFDGYARDLTNGGTVVELDPTMVGRPAEPQRIVMPTYKPDGTMAFQPDGMTPDSAYPNDASNTAINEMDLHERAIPTFLRGSLTDATIPRIETPAAYLKLCMGQSSFAMRRQDETAAADPALPVMAVARDYGAKKASPFVGWTVVDSSPISGGVAGARPVVSQTDGSISAALDAAGVGLIIRERPQPDNCWWEQRDPVTTDSPWYLPYSYGKHTRPEASPFYNIDVSACIQADGEGITTDWYAGIGMKPDEHPAPIYRPAPRGSDGRIGTVSGGVLMTTATTANHVNSLGYNGTTYTPSSGTSVVPAAVHASFGHRTNQDDSLFGEVTYPLAAGIFHNRSQGFYRENWRFLNFIKPDPVAHYDTTQKGWRRTTFPTTDFTAPSMPSNLTWRSGLNISGKNAIAVKLVQTDGINDYGVVQDYSSARWEGLITTATAGYYNFQAMGDDGFRVWINDQLMIDYSAYTGSYTRNTRTWVSGGPVGQTSPSVWFRANQQVRCVVEATQGQGGFGARLQWSINGGAYTDIPYTMVNPRRSDNAAGLTGNVTVQASTFRGASCVISSFTQKTPMSSTDVRWSDPKAGLMIRSGVGGLSPLVSGKDQYVALIYTPDRGVFVQYRKKPAQTNISNSSKYFIGTGVVATKAANAFGVVATSSTGSGITANRTGTVTVTGPGLPGPAYSNTSTASISKSWSPGGYASFTVPEGSVSNVSLGPVTLKTSLTGLPSASTRTPAVYTATLDAASLSAPLTQIFRPADANQRVYFYRNGNDIGTASPAVPFSWTGHTVAADGKSLSVVLWSNWSTTTLSPVGGGTLPITRTAVVGNNKTFYTRAQVMNGGVVVKTLTWDETKAELEKAYGGTFTYDMDLTPDYPSVADLIPSPLTVPPYPTAPGAVTNATYTGTHTFEVARSGIPTMDVNPFQVACASAAGAWSVPSANITPYLPISATAPLYGNLAPWPVDSTGTSMSWATAGLPAYDLASGYALRPDVTYPSGAATVPVAGGAWDPSAPSADDPSLGEVTTLPLVRASAVALPVRLDISVDSSNQLVFSYISNSTTTAVVVPGGISLSDLSPMGSLVTTDASTKTMPGGEILVGVCAQSGDRSNPLTVAFDDMRLVTTAGTVDANTWEGCAQPNNVPAALEGTMSPMSAYLASQYQVFFGPHDITYDFFKYGEGSDTTRLVTEDWLYQPREYWSQSKWWDDDDGLFGRSVASDIRKWKKDSGVFEFPTTRTPNCRELLARNSVLCVNLGNVQNYIKNRTIRDASYHPVWNANTWGMTGSWKLASKFRGVIYVARTNRYPWNPLNASKDGLNPWNPLLPNTGPAATFGARSSDPILRELRTNLAAASDASVSAMQPYPLDMAPALRPYINPGAVLLHNAGTIDWQYDPASGVPSFGNSKLLFVTPDPLYIQGNVNYSSITAVDPADGQTKPVYNTVLYKGSQSKFKPVPFGVIADNVTFLSNNFQFMVGGVKVSPINPKFKYAGTPMTGTAGAGVTAVSTSDPMSPLMAGFTANMEKAATTYFRCAIVSNNQPTTRETVKRGEAASVINLTRFLENWNGVTFDLMGAFVVLDTCRHTKAYMLDAPKPVGWGPFGFHALSSISVTPYYSLWNLIVGTNQFTTADQTTLSIPFVQGAPNRVFAYNPDLLTSLGTPPETPTGIGIAGRGGWAKIIK